MSKLFKLKKWLTIPEAAAHLERVLEEEVNAADVLRLVLDGELEIAVNFVNHATARRGKLVYVSTADMFRSLARGEAPEGLKVTEKIQLPGRPKRTDIAVPYIIVNDQILPNHWLSLEDDIITLTGVWDVPMIGSNVLDVEHAYQMLTGGPEVTLESLDGDTLVGSVNGTIYQLQEDFDWNPYQSGSLAHKEEIKKRIARDNISGERAERVWSEFRKEREAFLDRRRERPERSRYYPAGGLPHDSVFVVRTSAINAFLHELGEDEGDDNEVRAVTRTESQETAILDALESQGFDPLAIPLTRGKGGAKQKVKSFLLAGRRDLFTPRSFDKAWERLRGDGRITDSQ